MRKFNVVVTIIQEYEIEIDETLYNEDWKTGFENAFWDLPDGLKDVAKDLARHKGLNNDIFQEGYGVIKVDGKNPSFIDENPCAKGLNINIISENEDIDYEVNEVV